VESNRKQRYSPQETNSIRHGRTTNLLAKGEVQNTAMNGRFDYPPFCREGLLC